jgi:hypothetical protein
VFAELLAEQQEEIAWYTEEYSIKLGKYDALSMYVIADYIDAYGNHARNGRVIERAILINQYLGAMGVEDVPWPVCVPIKLPWEWSDLDEDAMELIVMANHGFFKYAPDPMEPQVVTREDITTLLKTIEWWVVWIEQTDMKMPSRRDTDIELIGVIMFSENGEPEFEAV